MNAVTNAVTNEQSSLPVSKLREFQSYFVSRLPAIRDMVPRELTPERVAKIAIFALARNPVLLQCKPETVWRCVANAAGLGLEVDYGQAHLVPFRNSKTGGFDCQLIVGYQGLIELAVRSGRVVKIGAHIVREHDEFDVALGTEARITHRVNYKAERGQPVAVYAVATLADGTPQFDVMSVAEVEAVRNMSRAKDADAWTKSWDEMAKKTVTRRLCKYLPKSPDLKRLFEVDEHEGSDLALDADVVTAAEEQAKNGTGTPAKAKKLLVKGNDASKEKNAQESEFAAVEKPPAGLTEEQIKFFES